MTITTRPNQPDAGTRPATKTHSVAQKKSRWIGASTGPIVASCQPPAASLPLGHRDEDLLPVTPDDQEHGPASRRVLQCAGDLADIRDRLPVDVKNDVVWLDAGVCRDAATIDIGHDCGAAAARQIELTRDLGRDRLELHAEVSRGRGFAFRAVLPRGSAAVRLRFEIQLVGG